MSVERESWMSQLVFAFCSYFVQVPDV